MRIYAYDHVTRSLGNAVVESVGNGSLWIVNELEERMCLGILCDKLTCAVLAHTVNQKHLHTVLGIILQSDALKESFYEAAFLIYGTNYCYLRIVHAVCHYD